VLSPGERFFFLRKQAAGQSLDDRRVIGHAEYRLCENRPLGELAGYYGLHELGVASQQELERRMVEIAWNGDMGLPRLVGVIQLGPLEQFRHPVKWKALPKVGIKFSANVLQGIGLDEGHVEALLDAGLYGRTN
jgi:hypothetical protein